MGLKPTPHQAALAEEAIEGLVRSGRLDDADEQELQEFLTEIQNHRKQ